MLSPGGGEKGGKELVGSEYWSFDALQTVQTARQDNPLRRNSPAESTPPHLTPVVHFKFA
jgi:hypothetical protein